MPTALLGRCLLVVLVGSLACGGNVGRGGNHGDIGCGRAKVLSRISFLEQRRIDPDGWLLEQLQADHVEVRSRAALALGRMTHPRALAGLIALLRDTSPSVRASAAFALQTWWLDRAIPYRGRSSELDDTLIAVRRALRRDRDRAAQSALLHLLGWLGRHDDVPRIAAHLTAATSVEAAVESLGLLARRGLIAVDDADPLLPLLRSPSARLRRSAAWALAAWAEGVHPCRRGLPGLDPLPAASVGQFDTLAGCRSGGRRPPVMCWSNAITHELRQLAIRDADEETRALAIRAVGSCGGRRQLRWLVRRAIDPAPRVQAEVAWALGRSSRWGAVRLTTVISQLWRSVGANRRRLTGAELHPVLVGLNVLGFQAKVSTVAWFANEMLHLADASDAVVDYGKSERQSLDLVHCAAARLWDRAARRPDRTPTCGTARAPQLGPAWRKLLVVTTLGDLVRPPELKAAFLRRYFVDENPYVRAASTALLGQIDAERARSVIRRALRDRSTMVVAAAAEVIRSRPVWFTAIETRQLLADRLAHLDPFQEPLATCAVVGAVAALRWHSALPQLKRLRHVGSRTVRACADGAVMKMDYAVEAVDYIEPSPLAETGWPKQRSLPRRAIFETSKGNVVLEMAPEMAPVSVSAFANRTTAGIYSNAGVVAVQPFESVVIGVAARASRSPSILSELHPSAVNRGTVMLRSMAPDTATGELTIALSRQPQLDGRVTVIAHVVAGLDALDSLQVGDTVRRVRLSE